MTVDLHSEETLMEFPCDFQLKAMGHNTESFMNTVFEITQKYAPETTRDKMHIKDSKGKKFISVNIHFEATSLKQLHAIYGDLKAHPEVLMTL